MMVNVQKKQENSSFAHEWEAYISLLIRLPSFYGIACMRTWLFVLLTIGSVLFAFTIEMDPLERVYRLDVSSNGNRIGLLSSSGILSVTALELQARKSGISILYGKDDNPFTGNSRGLRLSGDHGWTATLFSPFSDMSSPVYLSLGERNDTWEWRGFWWYRPHSASPEGSFIVERPSLSNERVGAGCSLSFSGMIGCSSIQIAQGYRSNRYVAIKHLLRQGPLSLTFRIGDEKWPVFGVLELRADGTVSQLQVRYGKRWGPLPLFGGEAQNWRSEGFVSFGTRIYGATIGASCRMTARYSAESTLTSVVTHEIACTYDSCSVRASLSVSLRPKRLIKSWSCIIRIKFLEIEWYDDGFQMKASRTQSPWTIKVRKRWGERPSVTFSFSTNRET